MKRKLIVETFDQHWKRDINGCWTWQRACKGKEVRAGGGYGCFRIKGKMMAAHIFSWERAHRRKVSIGKQIMHTCHNTKCVNPAHLMMGTNDQNADMKARAGRAPSKLTPTDVRRIRSAVAGGTLQRIVAAEHDLYQADVSNIVNRKYWKHVA